MPTSVPSAPHPKWSQHPASKIIDPGNIANAQLRSHQDAINARWMAKAAEAAKGPDMTGTASETPGLDNQSLTPQIRALLPEPLMTNKHTNPTIETDVGSD